MAIEAMEKKMNEFMKATERRREKNKKTSDSGKEYKFSPKKILKLVKVRTRKLISRKKLNFLKNSYVRKNLKNKFRQLITIEFIDN